MSLFKRDLGVPVEASCQVGVLKVGELVILKYELEQANTTLEQASVPPEQASALPEETAGADAKETGPEAKDQGKQDLLNGTGAEAGAELNLGASSPLPEGVTCPQSPAPAPSCFTTESTPTLAPLPLDNDPMAEDPAAADIPAANMTSDHGATGVNSSTEPQGHGGASTGEAAEAGAAAGAAAEAGSLTGDEAHAGVGAGASTGAGDEVAAAAGAATGAGPAAGAGSGPGPDPGSAPPPPPPPRVLCCYTMDGTLLGHVPAKIARTLPLSSTAHSQVTVRSVKRDAEGRIVNVLVRFQLLKPGTVTAAEKEAEHARAAAAALEYEVDPSGFQLRRVQLERLANNEAIVTTLKDERLQNLLTQIDISTDREKALSACMNRDSHFQKFMDEVLDVLCVDESVEPS